MIAELLAFFYIKAVDQILFLPPSGRNGATTLSITTFSIMTLSIRGLHVTLSITMLCHYAEYRILFIIMLNVVMLSVVVP